MIFAYAGGSMGLAEFAFVIANPRNPSRESSS